MTARLLSFVGALLVLAASGAYGDGLPIEAAGGSSAIEQLLAAVPAGANPHRHDVRPVVHHMTDPGSHRGGRALSR